MLYARLIEREITANEVNGIAVAVTGGTSIQMLLLRDSSSIQPRSGTSEISPRSSILHTSEEIENRDHETFWRL